MIRTIHKITNFEHMHLAKGREVEYFPVAATRFLV